MTPMPLNLVPSTLPSTRCYAGHSRGEPTTNSYRASYAWAWHSFESWLATKSKERTCVLDLATWPRVHQDNTQMILSTQFHTAISASYVAVYSVRHPWQSALIHCHGRYWSTSVFAVTVSAQHGVDLHMLSAVSNSSDCCCSSGILSSCQSSGPDRLQFIHSNLWHWHWAWHVLTLYS